MTVLAINELIGRSLVRLENERQAPHPIVLNVKQKTNGDWYVLCFWEASKDEPFVTWGLNPDNRSVFWGTTSATSRKRKATS